MNKESCFDLIIDFVFTISPQLLGLVTKAQDLVISFCICEGETLPRFHLRVIHIGSETFLLQDKKIQINNLTGKYTMGLSKLKQCQQYMTNFELNYRMFERLPKLLKSQLNSPSQLKKSLKPYRQKI